MPGLRVIERQLVRADKAKSIPRAEHNLGPSLCSAINQWTRFTWKGKIDSLRSQAGEYIAQEVG